VSDVVAFDTETGGLDWFEPDQQAFLITWATKRRVHHADVRDPAAVAEFVKAIEGADEIIGHNLPFDIHMVRATIGLDILDVAERNGAVLWDTHIMSVIYLPEGQRKGRGGHGLEALTAKFLDRSRKADDKDELGEAAKALGGTLSTPGMYRKIYESGPDGRALIVRYARADARDTFDLRDAMFTKVPYEQRVSREKVLVLEHALMPVVIRAEQRGVATDQEQVLKFKREFEQEERALRAKLNLELGGAPETDFDSEEFLLDGKGSRSALREALLKVGVPLTERSKDRTLSTSKNALAEFVPDFPVIADLFEWRRVSRFLSTYIGPMVCRKVIHTSYQANEPWTGRMASRRPNMQNWPRRAGQEVRNVLQARPGHSLVIADYAQMEAMIIVRYLNDPALIDAMDDGLDLNAWMAAQIWGGEPSDWGKDTPNAEGERSRATARHTLYATLYGAGGRRISQQLPFLPRGPYYELDEEGALRDEEGNVVPQRPWKDTVWPQPGYQYQAARDLANAVKQNLPGYKAFRRRLDDKIKERGYVTTYYGRQNPVGMDKSYVAVAALVQGTGADILKIAAVRAAPALKPLGGQLVMFTHDELVAEVPDAYADDALTALVDAMETAAPDHRPRLRADGAIVKHYGEAH
jgi:DNA polymerase-1